jgi:hypothetical protein
MNRLTTTPAMKITPQEALLRCIEHREIFHDEMLHLFRQIMSGEMSPTMIAALTIGLRVKKETIGEIAAAAQVMREFSTKVPMADTTGLLDIVGTGGDGAHTFNISRPRRCLSPPPPAHAWPSMAGAACRRRPAAPTSSKRWARTSTSNPSRSPSRSRRPASASCSPRTITRP